MTTDADRIITGSEPSAGDGSALDALIGFYRAFNHRDLDGLALNWAPADRPSMDNPIGGIRRGWASIREGYMRLFSGRATVRVEFFDFTSEGDENYHLFVGRERGICAASGVNLALRIRTTRWFARLDGLWRQIHHHGSIEEPALLAEYQRVILGAPLGQGP